MLYAGAPLWAPSPADRRRRTVERMADTRAQTCVGRGDGSDCPEGESGVPDPGVPVYQCPDCRDHWAWGQKGA